MTHTTGAQLHDWREPVDGEPREEGAVCRKCGAYANSDADEPCPIDWDAVNARREAQDAAGVDEALSVTSLELQLIGSMSGPRHAVRVPGKPYPAEIPDALLQKAVDELRRLRVATARLAELTDENERLRAALDLWISGVDAQDNGMDGASRLIYDAEQEARALLSRALGG